MKQVKIISLFLFLVVFPLGSWFYLQKGLDFRKALGKELEVKGQLTDYISSPAGLEMFRDKTSLVILPNADIDTDLLDEIYEQFKQAYTFQLVNGNRKYDNSVFSKDREWVNQTFNADNASLTDKTAFIVDKEMNVRNYYKNTDAELKSLVRQLAISFPRRPARDIIEKKDIQKNEE